MKDFLITIHNGGDEAVAAVQRMSDDWRAQLEQAAREVEGLRLTDEERSALRTVIGGFGMWVAQNELADDESLRLAVVTLRGLLGRHDAT